MTIQRITEKITQRFWAKVNKTNGGCWLWISTVDRCGYGKLSVNYKTKLAHRISWEIHHGPIPAGRCVLHNCDNPGCVNPRHLFLGSVADNMRDMSVKGRTPRGEAHPKNKLSIEDITDIRAAAGRVLQIRLSEQYGVSKGHICKIIARETWTWLP